MTFCLGIKVRDGLVGLADTRIVKGSEHSSKTKVSRLRHESGELILMTSGLRSVRDKAAIYFQERMSLQAERELTRMYQAANLFGNVLHRVREEDGDSLEASHLKFNLNGILAGRLPDDTEPELIYVYPEGNWILATEDAPYHIIGRTSYGRPILDRLLRQDTSLGQAVSLAYLAFDATRASVTDVDFPIDIVVFDRATGTLKERRYDQDALAGAHDWWAGALNAALAEFPLDWAEELLNDANP